MRTLLGAALSALLVCQAAVSGTFLNEAALSELAEREGYQLTLQAVERVRRQASECQCPPPPSSEEGDGPPPPPPPPRGPPPADGSSSEEGDRPHGPPPPGCWPPPPPHGHHHHHHRGGPGGRGGHGPHPWGMEDYSAPACELRPLFRVPNKFNFTARIVCFEQWELNTAEALGMSVENRFDPTSEYDRYRPTQRKPLLWNKGCDMQCHFMELDLLAGEDQDMSIKPEAVTALMKEEGDSSDITAAIDKAVESCVQSAAELVHPKQVCRSGADEVLFCLQRTIEETCPGAKWQGQRSCDEVADAGSKVRACRRRMMFHGPPPPRFGPPPFPRPPPVLANSLPAEGSSADVSDAP